MNRVTNNKAKQNYKRNCTKTVFDHGKQIAHAMQEESSGVLGLNRTHSTHSHTYTGLTLLTEQRETGGNSILSQQWQ